MNKHNVDDKKNTFDTALEWCFALHGDMKRIMYRAVTLGKLEREARHLLVDVVNGNEGSKALYLQKLNEIDGYDL